MRPYVVWSLNYKPDSSGEKVLHRLCHELNLAGQQAFVSFRRTNPEWQTPFRRRLHVRDWIAVYPEVATGNPLRAPRVVRYVLNKPGLLGGEPVYDPRETVFVFSELFNTPGVPPERIMKLPAIELDIYYDRHLPRSGTLYYVGRSAKTRDVAGTEVTTEMRRDRYALADALNRAELLVSFANMTAMLDIARLCGCPVMIVPDGSYTREQLENAGPLDGIGWDEMPQPFDSDVIRKREAALYPVFLDQLAEFIRVTQG